MVGVGGLEPPWGFPRQLLRLVRLPIPPYPRIIWSLQTKLLPVITEAALTFRTPGD